MSIKWSSVPVKFHFITSNAVHRSSAHFLPAPHDHDDDHDVVADILSTTVVQLFRGGESRLQTPPQLDFHQNSSGLQIDFVSLRLGPSDYSRDEVNAQEPSVQSPMHVVIPINTIWFGRSFMNSISKISKLHTSRIGVVPEPF